ncbi:unnamed protein product [Ceutorhynchus assimilis]|uniref:Ribosomal RNA-processing protein 8 n=1 Tax=Ceutorhynchus assimilis TaxID=467358 RepID=A0A9N9MGZ6_9CUCU|nr:unnamed protein product [Ceutorhynchus assimilis]
MALFKISGSEDWAVSEAAETLCQNFDKDNVRKKKKKKKKQKIIHKTKVMNEIKTKGTKKVKTISSSVSEKIINGKKRIKKKITQTILKKAEDETPLNSSFSEANNTTFTSKKGLKRKCSISNCKDETKNSKKTKQEIITKKEITIKPSNVNDQFQEEKGNSKKHEKKMNINEPLPNSKQEGVKKNPVLKNKQDFNSNIVKKRKDQLEKLKTLITNKGQNQQTSPRKHQPILTLRQKMMGKLKAARFRFLNEQIYSTTGQETEKIFRRDPEAFKAYHEGYKQQVRKWPLNPVDKIIKSLNKIDKNFIIADFGCGEAKLAKSLQQKVHSFDLVASNELVTACDMAHVPLEASSVNVVVFCLSLMGTNLKDYLLEANRILKIGGMVKIAEVESRFEDVHTFIKSCEQFGFKKSWMDLSYNLFYFIDLKKESNAKDKNKLPVVSLQPCLYKKR